MFKQSGIITTNQESGENILNKGDITIEDDVWIGYGATILSGAHISRGAIIGAKSTVAGYIPPYSIYVGNKVIKYRFSNEVITELLKIDYKLFSNKLKESPNQLEKYLYQDVTEKIIQEMISTL